jgi:putative effector of murein hydrolase
MNCREVTDYFGPLKRLNRFTGCAFFYFLNKFIVDHGPKVLPPPLLGMIGLFAFLLALERYSSSAAQSVFNVLEPGYRFLLKWAPLYFVPALVKLACLPDDVLKLLTGRVLVALLVLMFGGMFVQFVVCVAVASLFPDEQSKPANGAVPELAAAVNNQVKVAAPSNPYPRPGTPFERRFLPVYAAVMALSIVFFHAGVKPELAEDIFMMCASFLCLVGGNSMSLQVRRIAHPILVTMFGSWVFAWMWAVQTGSQDFQETLVNYSNGTGAYLSMFLGPLVVALAFLLYEKRELLLQNLLPILTVSFVSSVSGLFSTALFCRMLMIPKILALSSLARFLTSPLALEIAKMLKIEADLPANQDLGGLTIAMVTVSCLLAAIFGEAILTTLRVQSTIAHGLTLGTSAAVFGVVSLTTWSPKAVPYAAVGFVLAGAISVVLVAMPPVMHALLFIVG